MGVGQEGDTTTPRLDFSGCEREWGFCLAGGGPICFSLKVSESGVFTRIWGPLIFFRVEYRNSPGPEDVLTAFQGRE